MRRVRVRIEKIVLQHPNITAADGARLGRMVEQQLQRIITGNPMPRQQSIGEARVQVPFLSGARASHLDAASAIAVGVHRAISVK
jgi:hypothetical protein